MSDVFSSLEGVHLFRATTTTRVNKRKFLPVQEQGLGETGRGVHRMEQPKYSMKASSKYRIMTFYWDPAALLV